MRALLAAALFALAAGCADDAAAPEEPPVMPAEPMAASSEESLTMEVTWYAWASLCDPVLGGAGAFVSGGSEPGGLEPPENLTALSIGFTWSPVNPTAENLRFFLLDGDDVLATVVGASPLVMEVPQEALAEQEGGLDLVAQPAECPVAPANAASTDGQAVDVLASYSHLVVGNGTAA